MDKSFNLSKPQILFINQIKVKVMIAREEELESGSLIVLMVLVEAKHVPGPRVEVEGRGQWDLEVLFHATE